MQRFGQCSQNRSSELLQRSTVTRCLSRSFISCATLNLTYSWPKCLSQQDQVKKRMGENGRGWKRPQNETSFICFVWPKRNTKAPCLLQWIPRRQHPSGIGSSWFALVIRIFWMRACTRIHQRVIPHGNVLWHVIALLEYLKDIVRKRQFQGEVTTEFYGECDCAMMFMIMNPVGFMPTALLVNEFVWVRKATGSWMVFGVALFHGSLARLKLDIGLLFHLFLLLQWLIIIGGLPFLSRSPRNPFQIKDS